MNMNTSTAVSPVNLTGHVGTPLNRPLRLAVVGAGARGAAYAELAAALPDRAQIVAVAEIRDEVRERIAVRYGARAFSDWRALADLPRLADAVVIATMDSDHLEAARAFASGGYDILLEKPMATNEADCEAIARAARGTDVTLAVCHVMRYTLYTKVIKDLIRSGRIGDLVNVQHLEPIGYYHFAHSFVRGNWRREDESTFILLSKSCHDIDWLSYVIGRPATRVASFGGLAHFRPDRRPVGAADRCLDCAIENDCPFSAVRLYRSGLRDGGTKRYFTQVMADALTEEDVTRALAEGPYGRCVYGSDNDVVDHQTVNLEYEGGITASFSLTAFSPLENRHTKIFGTRGQLTGDGRFVHVYDFRTEETTTIDTSLDGSSAAEGHAGGDAGLVHTYINALYEGRPELIISGVEESLASHRIVFAAERARRSGTVVTL
jgi:predicted dehydrogenase